MRPEQYVMCTKCGVWIPLREAIFRDSELDPWQPVPIAAKLAGMTSCTIYRWRREGHIEYKQINGRFLVYVPDFVPHWRTALMRYLALTGGS